MLQLQVKPQSRDASCHEILQGDGVEGAKEETQASTRQAGLHHADPAKACRKLSCVVFLPMGKKPPEVPCNLEGKGEKTLVRVVSHSDHRNHDRSVRKNSRGIEAVVAQLPQR